MILSGDVSGDDSIDDGTQSDGRYVELRAGDSECAEDATSDDDSPMKWTLVTVVPLESIRRSGVR